MADKKISELEEINLADLDGNDFFVIVDSSDTGESPTGATKKITKKNLLGEDKGVLFLLDFLDTSTLSITVRKSSNDTTQVFTDTSGIAAFVGAGNEGYVTHISDQAAIEFIAANPGDITSFDFNGNTYDKISATEWRHDPSNPDKTFIKTSGRWYAVTGEEIGGQATTAGDEDYPWEVESWEQNSNGDDFDSSLNNSSLYNNYVGGFIEDNQPDLSQSNNDSQPIIVSNGSLVTDENGNPCMQMYEYVQNDPENITSFTLSGISPSPVNGAYSATASDYNGKTQYDYNGTLIRWTGSQWEIFRSTTQQFVTTNAPEYPFNGTWTRVGSWSGNPSFSSFVGGTPDTISAKSLTFTRPVSGLTGLEALRLVTTSNDGSSESSGITLTTSSIAGNLLAGNHVPQLGMLAIYQDTKASRSDIQKDILIRYGISPTLTDPLS